MINSPSYFQIDLLRLVQVKDKEIIQIQDVFDVEGQKMKVVKPFGKVFVGETLYVQTIVKNISKSEMEYLNTEVEIKYQEKKSKFITHKSTVNKFLPDKQYIINFSFNIEELDNYLISFNLQFKPVQFVVNKMDQQQIDKKYDQKQFRVISKLPFDINHKLVNIKDVYYVEYTLKNEIDKDIHFNNVQFKQQLPIFIIKNIAEINQNEILEVGSIKKFIFSLTNNPNYNKNEIKNMELIQAGQIFLQWEKCGIYLGNNIDISTRIYELKIILQNPPKMLIQDQVTQICYHIQNDNLVDLELKLKLFDDPNKTIRLLGCSQQDLNIKANQNIKIIVNIIAQVPGINSIQGIKFYSKLTNLEIKFNNQELGTFLVIPQLSQNYEILLNDTIKSQEV